MDKCKEILRYQQVKLSQRQTAEILGISRNTVAKVLNASKAAGLKWENIRLLTERELEEKLFPKNKQEGFQVMPNYEDLVAELAKPGVTRKLLWEEYLKDCQLTGGIPFGYTQFCHYFNQFIETNKATMYFKHQPGQKIEVDWAGQTLVIMDTDSSTPKKGYLFVGTLPYSHYSYVEVTSVFHLTFFACSFLLY